MVRIPCRGKRLLPKSERGPEINFICANGHFTACEAVNMPVSEQGVRPGGMTEMHSDFETTDRARRRRVVTININH